MLLALGRVNSGEVSSDETDSHYAKPLNYNLNLSNASNEAILRLQTRLIQDHPTMNNSGSLNADIEQQKISQLNQTHVPNDNWLEMPKMDNFTDIFTLLCSGAVIFGGVIPYLPQYLKIKNTNSSGGFSTYVCLTLLLANILRIAFWFGHRFELPLLIQSFVMIIGMLAMMEICIRVRNRNSSYVISSIGLNRLPASNRRRSSFSGLDFRNFWDWDDLFSYVKFISLVTIILAAVTYLAIDSYIYIETLGYVAVFTEAMLGVPQLLRNYHKKSTRGMSVEMVIMWLSGDLFKTIYFILRHAPAQFIACGFIQVTVDILILFQVFWYGKKEAAYSKLIPRAQDR